MRNRLRTLGGALTVVAATAVLVAACSSGGTSSNAGSKSSSSAGQKQAGGTATWIGYDAGGQANWIFPVIPPQDFTTSNSQDFQWLMWRPLYWYGVNGTPAIDTSLSLGDMPVYSNGGKTATISLKPYKWSDGQPVTARDIQFWENLVQADPDDYGGSAPGAYPFNIVKTTVVNPSTIQFTFTKAYNTDWLLYNELSNITPLPQQVWDKTSATGPVGNYDMTKKGAAAVLAYLNSQSKQISAYATNPLWQTVDGPWRLTAFNTNGDLTMVPNPGYSGPVKPTLSAFKIQVYTDTNAEFDALASGSGPDVGFISNVEQSSQPRLNHLGYTEAQSYSFAIAYDNLNFNNPTLGPVFKQLYIRQSLQELMDQNGIDKNYFGGDEYAVCGPIPPLPKNSYIDSYAASCPFSYNPSKAAQTLAAHGWNVVKNGVDTCQSPGTGATQCGAGIAAGTKLEIPYIYATGGIAFPKSRLQLVTDFALAGVKLDLKGLPGNEASSEAVPCTASQSVCSWGMYNDGWVYSPDYYPSGEDLFETGAGYNLGSYSDPKADQLIQATNLNSAESPQSALNAYQDYMVQQAPVIWESTGNVPIEYRSNLHGLTPFNVFTALNPENWYYTK
jgi:peptide/nickel transport system substrate-binding protein